jgi:4-hydroxybenzoyl-CoA thioesterase
MRRVVQWGDCDPAGIIYTPRAVEFAIETLEAWYRDVLEASWASQPTTHGMGSPVVHVECDYLARLPADQPVALAVYVERIGDASITYRIVCGDGAEREFFRARVVACCLALPERRPKPIPETLRRRIEAYAAAWGNGGTANKGR